MIDDVTKDNMIRNFAANCIRLGDECREHALEVKRLKAEVESLESDLKLEKENEDRLVRLWQTANNEVHGQATQIAALIDNQTRLKAEVERLKEGNDCLGQMHDKEMERSAYLCEEVNRTTAWGRGLESDLSHARVEISFLKSEVERLDTLCKQVMKQHSDISCENIILRQGGQTTL